MARSNKQRVRDLINAAEWLAINKGIVSGASFIYRGENINIFDDPGPNLEIVLVEPWEVVFQVKRENLWFWDDITVSRYRPGMWEEYILNLAEKGKEEQKIRQLEKEKTAFKPIDDSSIFGGKEE